jgi:hypothetical protein
MLVLRRKPSEQLVTDDGSTDTCVKHRTAKERRLKAIAHRMDYQEQDDRLCFAATKMLQSSSYSALRGLKCEATRAVIAVHGVLPSHYLKQMAQTAIQQVEGIRGVTNLVEVHPRHSV